VLWAGCWCTVESGEIVNCFCQCTVELTAEAETEHSSCRHKGHVVLETRTSFEVETRLSFTVEMQLSRTKNADFVCNGDATLIHWRDAYLIWSGDAALIHWRDVNAEVETQLSLYWRDTNVEVERQLSLYWKDADFMFCQDANLMFLLRRSFDILKRRSSVKREPRVLGALPRV